jgi:hypothetical protein
MKTERTILLRLNMIHVKGSTRGCGVRYVMHGETPQGEHLRIETNPCSESNQTCHLRQRVPKVLKLAIREKWLAHPIADQWETSLSSGSDLESEFKRQCALANSQGQDHGQ